MDQNASVPAVVDTDAIPQSAELDSIREAMRDRHSPYWSGQKDRDGATAMQRRYQELVSGVRAGSDGFPAVPSRPVPAGNVREDAPGGHPPAVPNSGTAEQALENLAALGTIGAGVAKDLERRGDLRSLEIGESQRVGFLDELGGARFDVQAAFEGLGANTQAAIYGEMMRPGVPDSVGTASRSEINQFTATPHGAILAAEWGHSLPQKLSRVLHREERLTAKLDRHGLREWQHFFHNGLASPQERAAVLRKAAG